MIQIQEHDKVQEVEVQNEMFEHLSLVSWTKPNEDDSWGYYASFKIGAEWIDDKETLIVTTKRGMENIDFLRMFMTCFTSDLSLESFSKIYTIGIDKPAIEAPSLRNVMSLLMIVHFIGVVGGSNHSRRVMSTIVTT